MATACASSPPRVAPACRTSAALADACLTRALNEKDVDGVRGAIMSGANVDATGSDHMTALMTASSTRQLECVKVLLKENADIHVVDAFGRCVLEHAVLGGNPDIVDAVIAAGANPNTVDETGWSLAMTAVKIGNLAAFQRLLHAGAHINATDKHLQSCLTVAIDQRWLDCVECVIEAGADLNSADENGITPLMRALELDQLPIVLALLKRPLNLNARDWKHNTVLMTAIQEGCRLQIITALLRLGADVQAANDLGQTALMLAVAAERDDLAHALLDAGANVRVTDGREQSLLRMAAVKEKSTHLLTRLVNMYPPFELHEGKESGYSSAISAAASDKKYCNNFYVLMSAPYVTQEDIMHVMQKEGHTLLRGHYGAAAVRFFIECGIHPNAFNVSSSHRSYYTRNDCLLMAVAEHCPDMISYLVYEGLDVNEAGEDVVKFRQNTYRHVGETVTLAQRTMMNAGMKLGYLNADALQAVNKVHASWSEARDPHALRALAWNRRKYAVWHYMEDDI